MKTILVAATACSLLQHLLLGCCWHHQACAHPVDLEHACHAHQAHSHDSQPAAPTHSHDDCCEGRCWWLADHGTLQPPALERLTVAAIAAESPCFDSLASAATIEHLPQGLALFAPPVRAHLWNQLLLI